MGLAVDQLDPAFCDVVDPAQELQVIGDSFRFTEGIVYDRTTGWLLFSDIPSSRIYRWREGAEPRVWLENTHKSNGNCIAPDGSLVTCEHETSRVVRRAPEKGYEVLADRFQGKALNSPNDVVVKSDGIIYFTDPRFGRNPKDYEPGREQELPFQGVYRFDPSLKELSLLTSDLMAPNGLCFTADEKRLFINDSMRFHILEYDVRQDGSLSAPRLFAPTFLFGQGGPDGMKRDREGHLFLAAMGGVLVYAPDGKPLGRIRTPLPTANLCFGGPDGKRLFTASRGCVFSLRCKIPGL